MVKTFRSFLALVTIGLASFAAHSQQVLLATGTAGATYDQLVNQLIAVCGSDGSIVNKQQPGGSPATITDIVDNKVAGGIVQFDVLWMRSRNQDLSTIKTLVPLHREAVHIITLNKDVKQGGILGIGGNTVVLKDTASLRGLTVGAQGGSLYTAQALNLISGLGYVIVSDFKDTNAVLAALKEDRIKAAIIVGGAPMDSIKKLDKSFRILPFDNQTIDKVKDVYRPTHVVYENLSTAGVKTVDTDALLVVNDYKGAKMSQKLNQVRSCLKDNLDDLKETAGTHPAWRKVNLNSTDKPRWDVYQGK